MKNGRRGQFLTDRDAWAGSAEELLTEPAPRTDCPAHLPDAVEPQFPWKAWPTMEQVMHLRWCHRMMVAIICSSARTEQVMRGLGSGAVRRLADAAGAPDGNGTHDAAGRPYPHHCPATAKVRKTPSWPRSWANFSLF
jgi:hypothetical protein